MSKLGVLVQSSDPVVSVIIPAYNEEDIVSDTVEAALGIPGVCEVIVVDDGSSDRTAEIAQASGAHHVASLPRNLGKGGALNAVWPSARGNIFLLLDADLGASASEGVRLLEPLLNGDADMAIAVFNKGELPGDSRLSARSEGFGLVVRTAKLGIRVLGGMWMKAPLTGPRAVTRTVIERVGGFAPRFGVEVALTIDALRMGYRVVEVPVFMVHRPSRKNIRGFVHRGRQMLDVLFALGNRVFRS